MKRTFRLLTILLLLLISFGSRTLNSSAVATGQRVIDPACVEPCRQLLFECLSTAQSQGEEKRCIAVYRRCIAHCK